MSWNSAVPNWFSFLHQDWQLFQCDWCLFGSSSQFIDICPLPWDEQIAQIWRIELKCTLTVLVVYFWDSILFCPRLSSTYLFIISPVSSFILSDVLYKFMISSLVNTHQSFNQPFTQPLSLSNNIRSHRPKEEKSLKLYSPAKLFTTNKIFYLESLAVKH